MMVPPAMTSNVAATATSASRMLPHHGGSGMSLDTGTTLSKRRGVVLDGGGGGGFRPPDSRNSPEPSTSIPLIEFHAPSTEEPQPPPPPPLRALGPPAYNRPPPPLPSAAPNAYPSTPAGGRFGIRQPPPPKIRSSPLRSPFSTAGKAAQGNHVVKHHRPPEDPNGIECHPETLPPPHAGGGGGRPPYIKYNSFANY